MQLVFTLSNGIELYQDCGVWVVKESQGFIKLDEIGERAFILLPLLEQDYLEFQTLLAGAVDKVMTDKFNELLWQMLMYPFEWRMEHWSTKSLDWIDNIGIQPSKIEWWALSVETQWMPQKLKHRFWKVFKIRRTY